MQDVAETLDVSEVVHVKLCVLLLHSGSPGEAVRQMEEHGALADPQFGILNALAGRRAARVSRRRARQYDVFGDLLAGSVYLALRACSATTDELGAF